MSTRSNIRPRPVDVNKQLIIYKDASELELDSADIQAAEMAAHVSGFSNSGSFCIKLLVLLSRDMMEARVGCMAGFDNNTAALGGHCPRRQHMLSHNPPVVLQQQ